MRLGTATDAGGEETRGISSEGRDACIAARHRTTCEQQQPTYQLQAKRRPICTVRSGWRTSVSQCLAPSPPPRRAAAATHNISIADSGSDDVGDVLQQQLHSQFSQEPSSVSHVQLEPCAPLTQRESGANDAAASREKKEPT